MHADNTARDPSARRVSVVVACNNEQVLTSSLRASPDFSAAEFSIQRGAVSAAAAYNRGIDSTNGDLLIFAHQDMYLPAGWMARLQACVRQLELDDPDWGVIGAFGVDGRGDGHGYLYSTGLQREVGESFSGCREVQTLDEVVLILRRSSGLRFDAELGGFHLYGADICMQARRQGMKNYAFAAFCVHNTNGISLLPASYWTCFMRFRRKWSSQLPIMTPCMPVTRFMYPAFRYVLRTAPRHALGLRKVGRRVADPSTLPVLARSS